MFRPRASSLIYLAARCASIVLLLSIGAIAASRVVSVPADDSRSGLTDDRRSPTVITYSKGQTLVISGLTGSRTRTLAIVFQDSCKYCERSMPFYRTLSGKRAELRYRLVVLAARPSIESTQFFEAQQVAVDQAIRVPLTDLKVPGTPTLILMDDRLRILEMWVGQLRPEQETTVLASLEGAGGVP